MTYETTDRGFDLLTHATYPPDRPADDRLMQQSSAIDASLSDGFDRPGTSYLWIGEHHHLDRSEVAELRDALSRWLETGRLSPGE